MKKFFRKTDNKYLLWLMVGVICLAMVLVGGGRQAIAQDGPPGPIPWEHLEEPIGNVHVQLITVGIYNNFNEVTEDNYQSFPGLYFELWTDPADEETAVGKITFTDEVNLSDMGALVGLEQLGDLLDMELGMIALDVTTISLLDNIGATLEMYGIPIDVEFENLMVFQADDTPLTPGQIADLVDNFDQDDDGNVSFDVAHFTKFELDLEFEGPPDIWKILSEDIHPMLLEQGINNNLNKVNEANHQAFEGLFFELWTDPADEDTAVGRITFTDALDLSDMDVLDDLQQLEQLLEMDLGMIDLDVTTISILDSIGATLEMYGIPIDVEFENLMVFEADGTPLTPGEIEALVDNFDQDDDGNVSFSVLHFTKFELEFDIWDILTDIVYPMLSEMGIDSNLDQVTEANHQNFAGLYFELWTDPADPDTAVGKITFADPLDLSDDDVLAFLQSLEQFLSMDVGDISLDVSDVALLEEMGAVLIMYGIPIEVDFDDLLVFDADGNPLTQEEIEALVDNFVQNEDGDVSFDVDHFTRFVLAPFFEDSPDFSIFLPLIIH